MDLAKEKLKAAGKLDPELLIVIPARWGSKRLRHKNILPYQNQPLFIATASSWRLPPGRVVVSTDGEEIASIARMHGHEVHWRDPVDDDQTIPEASAIVARDLDWEGAVLTIQPTVHPLPDLSTLILQDRPTILAKPTPHDIYRPSQRLWFHRGNLEQLIGVYYWPPGTVGSSPEQTHLIRSWEDPADIDTPADYALLTLPTQYNIHVIAAEPTTWNGTGHQRRQEELGLLLQHYGLEDEIPDLIILDTGNTTPEDIASHREKFWNPRIVTFEDRGPGALHADAIINSLVAHPDSPHHEYRGSKYAFIRSEFFGLTHKWNELTNDILLAFGGTDAKGLTAKFKNMVGGYGYDTHTPDEYGTMVEAMMSNNIVISGAGQIVHEAAYLGAPNITVAATLREAAHTHLGADHGNLYLGYAGSVTTDQMRAAVSSIVTDPHLRAEMRAKGKASVDGWGAIRILHILEGLLK